MNVRDSLLEKFFRPLAGMVSTMKEYAIFIACFSPPYGDSTELVQHESVRSVVFAPLWGLYRSVARQLQGYFVIAPYGDGTMLSIIDKAYPVFSSPYGDCIRMTTPKYPVMELSPPYGDCTSKEQIIITPEVFSPPYGDCTAIENAIPMEWVFSPPCGDSTLNISQNTAKLKGRMARKHSLYYNDVLLR